MSVEVVNSYNRSITIKCGCGNIFSIDGFILMVGYNDKEVTEYTKKDIEHVCPHCKRNIFIKISVKGRIWQDDIRDYG